MRQIDLDAGPITHLAFRPDGKMLGICFHEGFALLNMSEVLAGIVNPRFTPSRDRVVEMAWHPTGRCFALAGAEGIVQIHAPDGYKSTELVGLPGQHGPMTSVAFSPDGRHLVLGGGWWEEPGKAVVVSDYYWQPIAQLDGHQNQIGSAIFSGPNTAVTGAADCKVIFHDFAYGTQKAVIEVHAHVHAMAVSPDYSRLAVARGRRIEIWPLNQDGLSEEPHRIHCKGHLQSVRSVAFSPDGHSLASVGEDSTIRYWNTASGAELICFAVGNGPGRSIAYSPDGLLVAFAGKDGKLILMDAE